MQFSLKPISPSQEPDNDFDITKSRWTNLHDAAYEQLRTALLDGQFAPGQNFTIRGLAAQFGTSVMPVRDALKRLVAERALELRPNRSVLLPLMTRTKFLEILEIRLKLECMITRRAAPLATAELVALMERDHETMCMAVQKGDTIAYLAANRRFHFRLYQSAQTQVLMPLIEGLWIQIGPYLRQVFNAQSTVTDSIDHHHTDILKALRRQDAEAAAQAIRADLADAADTILRADQFAS